MPLAAARAGLVHVPVNPLLKHAQVAHTLADSGAALLIGTAARLSPLQACNLPAVCRVMEEHSALGAAAVLGSDPASSAAYAAPRAPSHSSPGCTPYPPGPA